VVVVGASLAGYATVRELRACGYAGRIHLIGDEPHLPYDRPPLSKGYLARTDPEDRIWLATLQELDGLDLSFSLGRSAVGVDPVGHQVELDDGSLLPYDELVIATGASPRLVAGLTPRSRPETVLTLRTLEDARRLSDLLISEEPTDPPRLTVIGASFIGCEVASTGLALGAHVTLIDSRETPMNLALHSEVGTQLAEWYERAGIELRLVSTVHEIMVTPSGSQSYDTEVRLETGGALPADVVVIGVGVDPNTGWLADSGLALDDGLVCDATLRATPGVWAVGDVCRWGAPGEPTQRLEHWTNAHAQAEHVARAITSGSAPARFESTPYYWSDQLGMRIEVVGDPPPGSDVEYLWGSSTADSSVAAYRVDGQVRAVAGINALPQVLSIRRLFSRTDQWTRAVDELEW
jgi:3-phenylpropionate/trans-cinnamate dioxygenase ferredoxin reductase subunit